MKGHSITLIHGELRRSEEARYNHRLHGVLLVFHGLSAVKAGKLLHVPGRSVAHWVQQFKRHGLEGLRDAERSGRPTTLRATQKKTLKVALKKSPKDVGLQGDDWTGALVSNFLSKRFGIKLSMRHCRRFLRS